MVKKLAVLCTVVLAALLFVGVPAIAQEKPIQLSLFNPIQLFPESTPIKGLRLNLIYGSNVSMTGLDFGLVNQTSTGPFVGVQFGGVGLADSDFTGWQDCWVNVTKGKMEGFQWGLVNYANHASGFQLGFVNYAVTMHGLQIGLVNIIKQGGQFPFFPIVNWSF
jgi:energy-converting hydrogenase Eha subunit A